MKKRVFLALLLAGSLGFSLLQSCKKDAEEPVTTNESVQSEEDNALAENTFNDAFGMVDEASRDNPGYYKKEETEQVYLGACGTVTVDTTVSPRVLTIDFGTGCTGADGRLRSGKIIATFSGRYRMQGTVITIGFDNYTVNGNKVEGTKTVTNMGTNASGNSYFSIEVKNAKITTPNGIITWESTREREWIEGSTTPGILDDVYLITGTAKGTNRKGETFDMTITKALTIKVGCRYIVSGTLDFTPQGKPTRTVDYGNGDCDNKATVSINGHSYTIEMR